MSDDNFELINFNYKNIYNNNELISNDSINDNLYDKNKNDEFEFIFNENKNDDNSLNDNEEYLFIKSTACRTNPKNKNQNPYKELNTNEIYQKEIISNLNNILLNEKNKIKDLQILMPPVQYDYEKIKKEILPKLNLVKEIKDKFINSDNLKELEYKMCDEVFLGPKKRNRNKNDKNKETIKKIGRKRKNDNSFSNHNKDSHDNIVKKIKAKILGYLLIFVNSILKSVLEENKIKYYISLIKKVQYDKDLIIEDLIKDLDYNKIVNETKREKNLNFLKLPLKDFLSNEISPKFSTYSRDSNKKVINEIIKTEKDNKIISFILNDLTLGNYIDIFLYKKELQDFGKLDKEDIDKIMDKFNRIDYLLNEIGQLNNENNYFSIFISIIYNIERWFFIKKERNKKKLEKE
jgi:hypothetical protein